MVLVLCMGVVGGVSGFGRRGTKVPGKLRNQGSVKSQESGKFRMDVGRQTVDEVKLGEGAISPNRGMDGSERYAEGSSSFTTPLMRPRFP